MRTHECPITGCNVKRLQVRYLMCRRHWFMVPKRLRDTIYDTVADRDDPYFAAVDEAIAHVEKREAER